MGPEARMAMMEKQLGASRKVALIGLCLALLAVVVSAYAVIQQRTQQLSRLNERQSDLAGQWAELNSVIDARCAALEQQLSILRSRMPAKDQVQDVIRARRLEVVNDAGSAVVALTSWKQGGWIETRSNDLQPLVVVGSNASGSGAMVHAYSNGKSVLLLGAPEADAGSITTYKNEKRIVTLGAATDADAGFIEAYCNEKRIVTVVPVEEADAGMIVAYGNGKPIVKLGAVADDAGSLRTYRNEKPLVTLGAATNADAGFIETYSNEKRIVTVVPVEGIDAGAVVTYSNEKPIVSLGVAEVDDIGLVETYNNAQPIVALGANVAGTGTINTYSATGGVTVSIGSVNDGGLLSVFNLFREEVVQAFADDHGLGCIGAFDRNGNGRTLTP